MLVCNFNKYKRCIEIHGFVFDCKQQNLHIQHFLTHKKPEKRWLQMVDLFIYHLHAYGVNRIYPRKDDPRIIWFQDILHAIIKYLPKYALRTSKTEMELVTYFFQKVGPLVYQFHVCTFEYMIVHFTDELGRKMISQPFEMKYDIQNMSASHLHDSSPDELHILKTCTQWTWVELCHLVHSYSHAHAMFAILIKHKITRSISLRKWFIINPMFHVYMSWDYFMIASACSPQATSNRYFLKSPIFDKHLMLLIRSYLFL